MAKDKVDPRELEELLKLVESRQQITEQPVASHLPYGTFFGPRVQLDFYDANIPRLPFGINEQEREVVRTLAGDPCRFKGDKTAEDVARQILSQETALDLSNYSLSVSALGARTAIASVLRKLVTGKRNLVAYASPNWVFEKVVAEVPNARYLSFYANSGDSFVQRCEIIAKNVGDKMAAVIVVDPANPLGYRLSKEQTHYLERVAEKHGFPLIFDDAFRGLQAKGQKDTAAMHTRNSIIVETTSKRFGARGAGVTWTLIPRDHKIELEETIACTGCKSTAGYLTDALYTTGYGERVQSWVRGNAEAFMLGYRDGFGASPVFGTLRHAFPEMPIITLHGMLTPDFRWNAELLAAQAEPNIGITSGTNWIKDQKEKMGDIPRNREEICEGVSYVRICPTKEPPDRSYLAGRFLAEIVASREKILEQAVE